MNAFCISSQSPTGLIQNMSALKERLVDLTDDDLASVSYTLSRTWGRKMKNQDQKEKMLMENGQFVQAKKAIENTYPDLGPWVRFRDIRWFAAIKIGQKGTDIGVRMWNESERITWELSAQSPAGKVIGCTGVIIKQAAPEPAIVGLKEWQADKHYTDNNELTSIDDIAEARTYITEKVKVVWLRFSGGIAWKESNYLSRCRKLLTAVLGRDMSEHDSAIMISEIAEINCYSNICDAENILIYFDKQEATGISDIRVFDKSGLCLLELRGIKLVNDLDELQNAEVYLLEIIKGIICDITGMVEEEIDETLTFTQFGLDSIAISEFTEMLNQELSVMITPDVLFNNPTVEKLKAYFIKNNIPDAAQLAEIDTDNGSGQEIAIIGMSGRFSEARNVEELWNILNENKNVTKVVPFERTEWRSAYDGSNPDKTAPGYLLTFSAKTHEALETKIKEFKEYVTTHDISEADLAVISYTLLCLREHFAYRAAFVTGAAVDWPLLLEQKGRRGRLPKKFKPQKDIVKQIEATLHAAASDPGGEEYVRVLDKLAESYCQGYDETVAHLWEEERKVMKPVGFYPFERGQYWLPKLSDDEQLKSQRRPKLHPMVHDNESDFTGQRYHSRFTGREFFFRDHHIKGIPVLPGVAYLEMAYTAALDAIGIRSSDDKSMISVLIREVGWFSPISLESQELSVMTELELNGHNTLSFNICTQAEEKHIHCKGYVEFDQWQPVEKRELDRLRQEALQSRDIDKLYQSYAQNGLVYGQEFSCITELYTGENLIMAKLKNGSDADNQKMIIRPGILDGAFQSTAVFELIDKQKTPLMIPFAAESIRICWPCTDVMWSVARRNTTGGNVVSYDLDLFDEEGNLCIQVRRFSSRVLASGEISGHDTFLVLNNDAQVPAPSIKTEKKINPLEYLSRRALLLIPNHHPSGEDQDDEIAIIGIAGKYPKAEDVEALWDNLRQGIDCIEEIPLKRWDHRRYYDPDKTKPGKTYSKWGGFIDGADEFDPLFFGISPREAVNMDPQERQFLMCVYKAIEDAGYTKENITGKERAVGVFAGAMYADYQLHAAYEQAKGNMVTVAGTVASIANRVSYFFNFNGPSITIDTMCSSSLIAFHFACQSIKNKECRVAVAGGVNLTIHPNKYLVLSSGKYASGDGYCKSFGEGGDGYVPGEGVGAVILKPLREAIDDKDHIYGVVKATVINHGGKTNGYTIPNPNAQAELIKTALQGSGIDPRTINYIEAHGTGTALGDSIEITGLAKAFEAYTSDKEFCYIGSVKSNIGHCEGAAGIAGISKVLMQLKYHKIAPSLHADVLNPLIDFAATPFVVARQLIDWERPQIKEKEQGETCLRRAGISAFGAGGSNAHVIIEEYEDFTSEEITADETGDAVAFIISARSILQLEKMLKNLREYLRKEKYPDQMLPAISYTLQTGREAMNHRLGFMAEKMDQLIDKLGKSFESLVATVGVYYGFQEDSKRYSRQMTAATIDYMEQRDLEGLIGQWTQGEYVAWDKMYDQNQKPHRLSLPTYEFEKEHYWLPVTEDRVVSEPVQEQNPVPKDIQEVGVMFEEDLKEMVARVIQIPPHKIGRNIQLADFGFDSISLVDFSGVINQRFGIETTPDLIYSYPTLAKLSEYLGKIREVAGISSTSFGPF